VRRIIYGARLLGARSSNRRHYLPECLAAAVDEGIYEGVPIYPDHKPGQRRGVLDMIGKVRNVRADNQGLRGDLYLTDHPLAWRLIRDVQRRSGVFALSHDAAGEGEQRDGQFCIEHIIHVNSVDVVTDAASTRNLWESNPIRTNAWQRCCRRLVRLLEADDAAMGQGAFDQDADADTDDDEMDPAAEAAQLLPRLEAVKENYRQRHPFTASDAAAVDEAIGFLQRLAKRGDEDDDETGDEDDDGVLGESVRRPRSARQQAAYLLEPSPPTPARRPPRRKAALPESTLPRNARQQAAYLLC
jgi:hypothetical protein